MGSIWRNVYRFGGELLGSAWPFLLWIALDAFLCRCGSSELLFSGAVLDIGMVSVELYIINIYSTF